MKMENPFQNEIKEKENRLKPVAIISRNIKIKSGMNSFSDIQITFPIFKEELEYVDLRELQKERNTDYYGIIDGNIVKVFKIGNTEPIAETNYAG
jgi:hypothetical protein